MHKHDWRPAAAWQQRRSRDSASAADSLCIPRSTGERSSSFHLDVLTCVTEAETKRLTADAQSCVSCSSSRRRPLPSETMASASRFDGPNFGGRPQYIRIIIEHGIGHYAAADLDLASARYSDNPLWFLYRSANCKIGRKENCRASYATTTLHRVVECVASTTLQASLGICRRSYFPSLKMCVRLSCAKRIGRSRLQSKDPRAYFTYMKVARRHVTHL